MKDIEQRMLEIKNVVCDCFTFLKGMGYKMEVKFINMESKGSFLPDMPCVKVFWTNRTLGRRIGITVYENYVTFCKIEELMLDKSFLMDHYFKWAWRKELGVHSMVGTDIDNKFRLFLRCLKDELKTSLREVLIGESWVDIPFDWQGEK